ncbi:protein DGS1, mitochondrial-like [Camellia sinensis]|uniref:protein DGS1, mitochondrial-like n=1 Tax=Camellia sinensis TaxID=4442 RepID=UPI00103690BD|nr:protein DGS1, mitochondrial-like [Camellia sinensis]
MGSSDIDNWIREAKDSTISFWNDHVERLLLSIRDELFETLGKRHKVVMDHEEVHLNAKSLHSFLCHVDKKCNKISCSTYCRGFRCLNIYVGHSHLCDRSKWICYSCSYSCYRNCCQ